MGLDYVINALRNYKYASNVHLTVLGTSPRVAVFIGRHLPNLIEVLPVYPEGVGFVIMPSNKCDEHLTFIKHLPGNNPQ
jgi:hypothetical protein